ncbi:MAG TPA: sugar ABC transporter permease [Thermomicrobiales bacterium]|jgi:multiple sugar transport system permease protein/sn-glycerol 3-phosphate transport system permease protein|nr:sugar ABC transporter permease [Thermomicrobiales bacterium]
MLQENDPTVSRSATGTGKAGGQPGGADAASARPSGPLTGAEAGGTTAATAVTGRQSRFQKLFRSEQTLFLLFILPNLVLFTTFSFWPLFFNVYLSLTSWNFLTPTRDFIGLDNYRYLFGNNEFWTVMRTTLIYTIGAVGGAVSLGLLSALLLNQKLKFRTPVRAMIFAPTLLSGVAISIVWFYIFDPRVGLLREMLGWIGVGSPPWLRDPQWALVSVIIVYVWKNLGFAAVIYLAGLQGIPKDLYEAAKVDGANAFQRFFAVTWPQLGSIHFFVMVTSILGTLQSFDIIRTLTAGGPVNATTNLIYYTYQQSFINNNAGRGASAAMVLFAVMLAVTVIQYRISERRTHYA